MTLAELVEDLNKFCKEEVGDLLARLQELRFKNQGDFNGNERWEDNQSINRPPYAYYNGKKYPFKNVQKDKGRNEPLVDSGHLKNELTNPANWKVEAKFNNNKLTLSFPDKESFTESKYDKLDTGYQGLVEYISPRGNYVRIDQGIPARPFKSISAQDVQWIRDQLLESLKRRYEQ